MQRIVIPSYAKRDAKKALQERNKFSDKPGLNIREARKAGVSSGVARAKQLVNSKTLSVKDAKAVGRFYDRFKNCRTPRCEVAIDLWGGRRFGRKLASKF